MKYDIIIIGGGPAGMTAAIYALRSNQKVLVLEKEVIGGKISSSPLVENYPGIQKIKGFDLAEMLREQVLTLGGKIKMKEVIQIIHQESCKKVITKQENFEAKAIILAMGTKYKTLGLEKENQLIGRGISFCATCDGFFYKNKTVAVIGGGNTAMANALELSNICQKVYIIQKLDYLTGEAILKKRLKEKTNIEILYESSVQKWIGDEKLIGIEIKQKEEIRQLEIDGAFLSIGQVPETEMVQNLVKLDKNNYIEINENAGTNVEGIFAAGDCVSKKIRQLTTAVNDGTIAALNAVNQINH